MLHAARPDLYRDPNHKPEMAVALTQFEALCGFRPLHEIVLAAQNHPELNRLLEISEEHLLEPKKLVDDKSAASLALQNWFGMFYFFLKYIIVFPLSVFYSHDYQIQIIMTA